MDCDCPCLTTSYEEWAEIRPSVTLPTTLETVREEFPVNINGVAVLRYTDRIVVNVKNIKSISEVISDVVGIEVFYSYNNTEYTYSEIISLKKELALKEAMKEVINLNVEEVVSMDIATNTVNMLTDFSEYVTVVEDTELYPVIETTGYLGARITFTTDKKECIQSVNSYYKNIKNYVDEKFQQAVSYGLNHASLTQEYETYTRELHDYVCKEYVYDNVTLYAGLSAKIRDEKLAYCTKKETFLGRYSYLCPIKINELYSIKYYE